jgi:RNA polymerase sigma factor (TIGR02999 family)
MTNVTQLLAAANRGDRQAAAELMPLVYGELRKLAAAKLANEKVGQTLDATALVHEAYLRLVGEQQFEGRGHFFAAAAEAMRRIVVESARRKHALKRGGNVPHQEADADYLAMPVALSPLDVLSVHDILDLLAAKSPRRAELVKLRYFLGCTVSEAAQILGIAHATAEEDWTYAKAWLRRQWQRQEEKRSDL